jgi:hypothetical protein
MTGDGRGYCGSETSGWAQRQRRGIGRAFRREGGCGFGWGYGLRASQMTHFAPVAGYSPPMDSGTEMRILQNRAELLRSELDQIQSRIAMLDKRTRPDTE